MTRNTLTPRITNRPRLGAGHSRTHPNCLRNGVLEPGCECDEITASEQQYGSERSQMTQLKCLPDALEPRGPKGK